MPEASFSMHLLALLYISTGVGTLIGQQLNNIQFCGNNLNAITMNSAFSEEILFFDGVVCNILHEIVVVA